MDQTPPEEQLRCPSCLEPMAARTYPKTYAGDEMLDVCWSCQGIWFDARESVQLGAAGVVQLFKEIHENQTRVEAQGRPLNNKLKCTRCVETLVYRQDLTKGGRISYYFCPAEHGRFTPFTQFMIEKGFVRALSPVEITVLAAKIQTVRCSGCGAPIDLQHDTACPFCKAPIAVLDADAVEKALASYGAATAAQAQALRNHDAVGEIIKYRTEADEAEAPERREQEAGEDLMAAGFSTLFRLLR
jgi:Zn-finger nucleic acid-binding protein